MHAEVEDRNEDTFAVRLALPLLLLAVSLPSAATGAPRANETYRIVLPRRALAAGERIELRLAPPAPDGTGVRYWLSSGLSSLGLDPPVYRAPLVIPVGTPPIKLTASISGPDGRASVSTEIELLPSSIAGVEDCLGPGQSFSTITPDIVPGYTSLDVLPGLLHKVEPEYPRSEFVRRVEDTIPVRSLVCRSGRVIDAYVPQRFRGPAGTEPIESDPGLVEAALTAARQYVYSPGMVAGHAIAVWVDTFIAFRR